MPWELELNLLVFLLIAALVALNVKDLLMAVVSINAFSFISALLFVSMGAVDVGFMEASVGAGVFGVLFIIAIYRTTWRSDD
jgi:energy-converting hydrogenase B subunit D